MGCIVEFFFEVFAEAILELIGYCYIKLMQLIVPDRIVSQKTVRTIKNIVRTVAALLVIVLIIGLIFLVGDAPVLKTVGKFMTYISSTIIVLQIAVGIIIKTVSHFKKQDYTD